MPSRKKTTALDPRGPGLLGGGVCIVVREHETKTEIMYAIKRVLSTLILRPTSLTSRLVNVNLGHEVHDQHTHALVVIR